VFAAATQGDEFAREILSDAGMNIANAMVTLALTVNPEIVVLGGGLVYANSPLIPPIHAGVACCQERSPVFRAALDGASVQVSALGQDAALLGAASLVTPPASQVVECTS
jgi:predicted NBD/HSP70 family sugar kinase